MLARRFLTAFAVAAAVLASPPQQLGAGRAMAEEAMMLPTDPAPLLAETANGEISFTVEVADDDRERANGLMFRAHLGKRHGMLFVFEQTERVGFWMKNTPLPLDLIFIRADGTVADVLPGKPFSEALIAPSEPVRFVLELEAGTAERDGIARGVKLRHPRIDRIAGR